MKRRDFIQKVGLASAAVSVGSFAACETSAQEAVATNTPAIKGAFAISTWNPEKANAKAWEVLKSGSHALDAIEAGIKVEEADANDQSVGYGGRPDREGNVTLDACIMNEKGDCGSVVFLKDIMHPISVARKVMEDTPHVMLAGEGAKQFALESGFEAIQLLTPKSEDEWKKWLKEAKYKPIINIENHDTIGMLAMDSSNIICGGCSTSGLAYKMHGRVGDSPIIGAGLFVDNEIGAAVATGMGEEVVKTVGSFLIVELMRQGMTPQQACEEAVQRIVNKENGKPDFQVAYIAFNKKKEIGAYSIHPGFGYVLHHEAGSGYTKAASFYAEGT